MWWNQKHILNEDLLNPQPALTIPSPLEPYPALTTPLPANIFPNKLAPTNIFPNKLAPNVPNNTLRNLPFYSFASFLMVLLTPSNNDPEFSRDLTIFKKSSISLFDIINVVL